MRKMMMIAALAPLALMAAVPLRWTVETSRVQPVTFEAYHGETLTLEATLQSYGKPVAISAADDWRIYWQTNGMGSAYWSKPATVTEPLALTVLTAPGQEKFTSAIVSGEFTPDMDTGASVVSGFLGCAGSNYRAAFKLRLRPSPGAVPNLLTVPPAVLDLANTTVINAPWPTDETITAVVREVVDETGIQAGTDGAAVTNIVDGILNRNVRNKGDLTVYETWISSGHPPYGYTGEWHAPHYTEEYMATADRLATTSQVESVKAELSEWFDAFYEDLYDPITEATGLMTGVYNYMHADENAWFSGTNYTFGAEAASRHKFAFEPGMDLGTVPCSMALIEKRDGINQTVWDQRDWTSWYWSFKAGQMQSKINATNEEIRAEIEARAPAAWSQRTAATGLANPDSTTTWIDTKTITLSPGMAWETIVNVDGCGYWTIVGNGTTIGGSGTNAVLEIKDFEGNRVLSVKKGSSYLVPVDKSQNVDGGWLDSDGRICFSFLSDIQPIGEYSTYLEDGGCFVDESDESCPVESEWEKVGDKIYRVHFRLKEGINSRSCFARFKYWKKGDTEIEFNGVQKISGGLIYNGVKIAPVIPDGAKVGDTITWKVVQ